MSVLLIAGTSHAFPVVLVPKQKSQSIKIRRVYLMYKKTAISMVVS
jgi:hypothetical protein